MPAWLALSGGAGKGWISGGVRVASLGPKRLPSFQGVCWGGQLSQPIHRARISWGGRGCPLAQDRVRWILETAAAICCRVAHKLAHHKSCGSDQWPGHDLGKVRRIDWRSVRNSSCVDSHRAI